MINAASRHIFSKTGKVAYGLLLFPFVTLLIPSSASAAAPRVGILVGAKVKQLQAAASIVSKRKDIQAEIYRLYEGTRELDRFQLDTRSQRHDAVVALGAKAHAFALQKITLINYAATFVLKENSKNVVPMNPSPEAWADLMNETLPRGSAIGTIAIRPDTRASFNQLEKALQRKGLKLYVNEINSPTEIPRALQQLVKSTQAFYYPRKKSLLNKKIAVKILKDAHAANIPIYAFSPQIVAAGATFGLSFDTAQLADSAVKKALGKGNPSPATLHYNNGRLKSLRISLPRKYSLRTKKH